MARRGGTLLKSDGPHGFLIFWLGGWTVGGIFAFWHLARILRPGVPEEFSLTLPTLHYDSGVAPFLVTPLTTQYSYKSRMEVWKSLTAKRRKLAFSPEEIQTLRLREFEGGNRLTIDKGAERIDLGSSLSQIEREWLFSVFSAKYGIKQA